MCHMNFRFFGDLVNVHRVNLADGVYEERKERIGEIVLRENKEITHKIISSVEKDPLKIDPQIWLTIPLGSLLSIEVKRFTQRSLIKEGRSPIQMSLDEEILQLATVKVNEFSIGKFSVVSVLRDLKTGKFSASLTRVERPIGEEERASLNEKLNTYFTTSLEGVFRELREACLDELDEEEISKLYKKNGDRDLVKKYNDICKFSIIKSIPQIPNLTTIITKLNPPNGINHIRELIPHLPEKFFSNMFLDILRQFTHSNSLDIEEDTISELASNMAEFKELDEIELDDKGQDIASYVKKALLPQAKKILEKFRLIVKPTISDQMFEAQFEKEVKESIENLGQQNIDMIHSIMQTLKGDFNMHLLLQMVNSKEYLKFLYGDTLDAIAEKIELEGSSIEDAITKIVMEEIKSSAK